MDLEKMKELLAEKICTREEWTDKLNESEPGHYGIEDWDVTVFPKDIWVDIQAKKFSFKNAKFNFDLLLGESREPISDNFSKNATGKGNFEIKNGELTIEDLEVEFDLDLYGDED